MNSSASGGRRRVFERSAIRTTRSGFSRELWNEMAELGWLGLQIPEAYDGLGLGFFDLCVVLEQSGRELMPEPFVSTLLLGAQALLLGGTEAQKKALLPRISAGETLVTVGYEEAGSHGDPSKVATTTRKSADGFELSGREGTGPRRPSLRSDHRVGHDFGFSLHALPGRPHSVGRHDHAPVPNRRPERSDRSARRRVGDG